MGRRKIEIQPITHERNRSVTFLKRKNGLFKKAYELGVLCSVDVAVIIFEERPGHEVKLHSYSSCDIRDIVQRHVRFQGERDSRGPGDFAGPGAAKFDDDGDDGEDDDDDESSRRAGKRKVPSSKLSMPTDMPAPNTPDYLAQLSHRNGLHLPNMGMPGGPPQVPYDNGPPPAGIGSLMPVSNDRMSNLRSSTRASKRPRTSDSAPSRSRSPSLDQDRLYMLNPASDSRLGGGGGGASSGGRISARNIRQAAQLHEQSGSPAGLGLPHHHYHPAGGDYNPAQPHYGPLFPIGGPGPMNMVPPIVPPPPRFEPQYDPALYQHQYPPSMIRQTSSVPVLGNHRDGGGGGSGSGNGNQQSREPQSATQRERGGGEMFAAFLEADERSRQMAAAQAATGGPGGGGGGGSQRSPDQLNWPPQGNPPAPADHTSSNTNNGNQPSSTAAATAAAGNTTENWFDIFSNASSTTGKVSWPRPTPHSLESLGVEIAQILANPQAATGGPPPTQPPTSAGASENTPVDEKTHKMDDNAEDDKKDHVKVEKGRRMHEDETEKDAEGEEDVDGDDSMKTDPTGTDSSAELKDGKIKSKTGKGRPKKGISSPKGRGKAKGS